MKKNDKSDRKGGGLTAALPATEARNYLVVSIDGLGFLRVVEELTGASIQSRLSNVKIWGVR